MHRKTSTSDPLISTCAYQGVRNVSFSKIFVYVLNTCIQTTTPEMYLGPYSLTILAKKKYFSIMDVTPNYVSKHDITKKNLL